jgi:IMP cyclohydrolase
MKEKKNTIKKRVSNRRYPERICKKPDCQENFVPSDARKIYCCDQHRVDFNNDKRKLKESFTVCFLKNVKTNRNILEKVKKSSYYKEKGYVSKQFLDYEEYDYKTYLQVIINKKTGREVHVCYDYTLELIDPISQYFLIENTLDYEL